MITEEIKQMTIEKRMILIEEIWQTIQAEPDRIESPEWHTPVLEQRKQSIKSNKANFISIEDLKNNNG